MYKIYLLLFFEFAKIGMFAIGGGYAAIPFLFSLQNQYNWFSIDELTNMIAIANLTPGPVGINMATYTGLKTAGLLGSIIATLSIVLVPFILAVIISKIFTQIRNSKNVKYIFIGLRTAACALLSCIAFKLFLQTLDIKNLQNFDTPMLILFILLVIPLSFFKKNPILTIFLGAIGGIIFNLFS